MIITGDYVKQKYYQKSKNKRKRKWQIPEKHYSEEHTTKTTFYVKMQL